MPGFCSACCFSVVVNEMSAPQRGRGSHDWDHVPCGVGHPSAEDIGDHRCQNLHRPPDHRGFFTAAMVLVATFFTVARTAFPFATAAW
jgi:hypothetical protein